MASIMEVLDTKHNNTYPSMTIVEAIGGQNGDGINESLNPLMKIYLSADIADSVDLLGKKASDMQKDIIYAGGKIRGTLHYVTGYTGFSGDPSEQEGNYLAIKVVPPTGMTIGTDLVVKINGVTLDPDGLHILIFKSHTKKFHVEASKDGYEPMIWEFDPSGLIFEKKVFTVSFNANGGSGSIDAVEVTDGDSITLPDGSDLTAPEDKQFAGWAKSASAQSPTVTSPFTPDKDTTLYAVWVDAEVEG